MSLVDSDDFRAAITENMALIWAVSADGKITRREAERVVTGLVVSLAERAGEGHTKEQLVAEIIHRMNGWLVDLFTRDPAELEARANELEAKGKNPERVAELRALAAERRVERVLVETEPELEVEPVPVAPAPPTRPARLGEPRLGQPGPLPVPSSRR